jgi:hypothetical protein
MKEAVLSQIEILAASISDAEITRPEGTWIDR